MPVYEPAFKFPLELVLPAVLIVTVPALTLSFPTFPLRVTEPGTSEEPYVELPAAIVPVKGLGFIVKDPGINDIK